jgi:two-component system chemotaxis response regulator CheB
MLSRVWDEVNIVHAADLRYEGTPAANPAPETAPTMIIYLHCKILKREKKRGENSVFQDCSGRILPAVQEMNNIGGGILPRNSCPPSFETRASRMQTNPAYDIIAMAASAGGLTALGEILAQLPPEFPVTVVVVQHLDPRHRSLMSEILARRTHLAVKQAEDGESLLKATVYIAPPNYHILVNSDRTISLTQSELVHFVRPSADLLFESVAGSYKDRSIAVVLTGTGSDGSMGVQAIKNMGGTVIVQNESTSEFFGMPQAAIATGSVDFILGLDEIASALVTLVMKGEV